MATTTEHNFVFMTAPKCAVNSINDVRLKTVPSLIARDSFKPSGTFVTNVYIAPAPTMFFLKRSLASWLVGDPVYSRDSISNGGHFCYHFLYCPFSGDVLLKTVSSFSANWWSCLRPDTFQLIDDPVYGLILVLPMFTLPLLQRVFLYKTLYRNLVC